MNPILPLEMFIPDVEARVWNDGRLYCYGSLDVGGGNTYCSHSYRVFSTDDLLRFVDHGESFCTSGPRAGAPWSTALLYAPDCVFRDGRYYLYFCQSDNSEGVAVADTPWGPFGQASAIPVAHRDAIDPAALVDDDGQAYLYWGQHSCRGARLLPDMRHIDESTLNRRLLAEETDGFHEGPCLRKRGDTYYLIYCDIARGKASCLSYATSKSPLGPFQKQGVIIDNDGCDPGNWNNHGSIVEFKGRWYVFYHRASQASAFNRRVCVEPIQFDDQGRIAEVEMTTQGVEGPLPATREIEAARACLLSGQVRSEPAAAGAGAGRCSEYLGRIGEGDVAVYKYFDFSGELRRFSAVVASAAAGGMLELRLDRKDGPCIGRCDIPATGGLRNWREVGCPIERVSGVHALYLVFGAHDANPCDQPGCSIEKFRFVQEG